MSIVRLSKYSMTIVVASAEEDAVFRSGMAASWGVANPPRRWHLSHDEGKEDEKSSYFFALTIVLGYSLDAK